VQYETLTASTSAVYYGMVEEIDAWVGELMDKLEARGAWNNTLFVFASDHGEMLGAHNTLGKTNFYEESARVPLLMSLPNGANKGTRVSVPVSLLDLHSTILDYLGAPGSLDTSDGRSLRRHVERSSYNQFFDDTVAVSEYEYNSDYKNTRKYGQKNAFMVRKGPYKLIVPRVANAPILDQLYNLNSDPYVRLDQNRLFFFAPLRTRLSF
jgi:choline-sulfatase